MMTHPRRGDKGRYTSYDPVIVIENAIRREHTEFNKCRASKTDSPDDYIDLGQRGKDLVK